MHASGHGIANRLLKGPLGVLFWTAWLAAIALIFVQQNGTALYNPYSQPERTASLQAWDELGPKHSNVLFLGDSRTSLGFIPAVVDQEAGRCGSTVTSFNLCAPLSTILSDAGVLDYVLRRGARPEVVVWGMGQREADLQDLPRFQRNEATFGFAWRLFRQVPSWGNLCTLGFSVAGTPRSLLQFPVSQLPQYQRELATMRRIRGWNWADDIDDWSRQYNKTFVANAPSDAAQWAKAIAKQHGQGPKGTFSEDATVTAALKYSLDRARQLGTRIIIVNMPTVRACVDVEKAHGYDLYVRWIKRICREEGASFVDLYEPPLFPPDTDFVDTYHLSAQGAKRLSRRFTREFIVPVLKASHKEAQP